MTTVVISDLHLTGKFDARKFDYLKGIIAKADWVIINGDFWDGELCTFKEFLRSRWKELFPLLRSKGAIYIYGNHDPRKRNDERTAFFSIYQTDSLDIRTGKLSLHIEHGDRIAPEGSIIGWLAPITIGDKPVGAQILALLAKIGLFLFGKWGLNIKERRNNEKMKRWCQQNLEENRILVCGHTHLAELDPSARFVNTGFIDCGYAQYLKIEDGEIILVEESY